MNIIKEIEKIQTMIESFEQEIENINETHNLKYYDVFIKSFVIPYSIFILDKKDNKTIIEFAANYDEILFIEKLKEDINNEKLALLNKSLAKEKTKELEEIEKIFGLL